MWPRFRLCFQADTGPSLRIAQYWNGEAFKPEDVGAFNSAIASVIAISRLKFRVQSIANLKYTFPSNLLSRQGLTANGLNRGMDKVEPSITCYIPISARLSMKDKQLPTTDNGSYDAI
jgi:hypothetical protein